MNEPQRRSPPPIAQSFVVCREIFEDCRSHDFVLVAPISALAGPTFPATLRMSIYAYLTCGHGSYDLTLQLRDGEDRVQWNWATPQPIRLENPLMRHQFALYDVVLSFPEPSRYDLVLCANGVEVARHALHVHQSEHR